MNFFAAMLVGNGAARIGVMRALNRNVETD